MLSAKKQLVGGKVIAIDAGGLVPPFLNRLVIEKEGIKYEVRAEVAEVMKVSELIVEIE